MINKSKHIFIAITLMASVLIAPVMIFADDNTDADDKLAHACSVGELKAVRGLLKGNIDPMQPDTSGISPYQRLIAWIHAELVDGAETDSRLVDLAATDSQPAILKIELNENVAGGVVYSEFTFPVQKVEFDTPGDSSGEAPYFTVLDPNPAWPMYIHRGGYMIAPDSTRTDLDEDLNQFSLTVDTPERAILLVDAFKLAADMVLFSNPAGLEPVDDDD